MLVGICENFSCFYKNDILKYDDNEQHFMYFVYTAAIFVIHLEIAIISVLSFFSLQVPESYKNVTDGVDT